MNTAYALGQFLHCHKIFGFLILAIAVQLLWDGAADFHS
jgi:hypothetical protein